MCVCILVYIFVCMYSLSSLLVSRLRHPPSFCLYKYIHIHTHHVLTLRGAFFSLCHTHTHAVSLTGPLLTAFVEALLLCLCVCMCAVMHVCVHVWVGVSVMYSYAQKHVDIPKFLHHRIHVVPYQGKTNHIRTYAHVYARMCMRM
jgi:hypothetical protein